MHLLYPLLFVLLDQLLLVTLQGSPGLYSLAPGPMALVPLGLLLLPLLLLLGLLPILQPLGPPPLDSTRRYLILAPPGSPGD